MTFSLDIKSVTRIRRSQQAYSNHESDNVR